MVSGDAVLRHSFYVNKERALDAFPQLNDENLSGAMIYFDGQQNDARMCLALAVTAARMGANVANYVEVTNLIKRRDGWKDYVKGAIVRDLTTGNEFTIRAKCVINATGPFTDNIRKIDNSITEPICAPSSGTHIVLPDYFCPRDIGLINAKSSDGRVIFMLPVGHTRYKLEGIFPSKMREGTARPFRLSENKQRNGVPKILRAVCHFKSLQRLTDYTTKNRYDRFFRTTRFDILTKKGDYITNKVENLEGPRKSFRTVFCSRGAFSSAPRGLAADNPL